jgi:N-acetylmuramoyl-L-alanine amidase
LVVLAASVWLGGCATVAQKSSERTTPSTSKANRAGPVRLLLTPTGVTVAVVRSERRGWQVRTPCGNRATITHGTPLPDVQVVIDPGHGGGDPGAVAYGLHEAHVNLQVARRLQRDLERDGIRAALTRTGDYDVRIAARADFIIAAQAKVFVSVQHNAGNAAPHDGPGTEVYYQHKSANSRRLAGLIWENVFTTLNRFPAHWIGASDAGSIFRLGRDGDDFYGVLRRTLETPGVLVETSYISEASQAALLATPSFRNAEAQAIASGIRRYLNTSDAGRGFRTPLVRGFDDPGIPTLTAPIRNSARGSSSSLNGSLLKPEVLARPGRSE